MTKRWMVGIDWCRSDASALRRLAHLLGSAVRVPNGDELISRPGCVPKITYHPKVFVMRAEGRAAIICGSGNLSANGLLRGCECGSVGLMEWPPTEQAPAEPWQIARWFSAAWDSATPWDRLADRYTSKVARTRSRPDLTILDEDARPVERRGLSAHQLMGLRTYDHFWIDGGALGANLGSGRPGNQLDMPRYCRVFFGAPATDLPPETEIDRVELVWGRTHHHGCTLKYADNHMDKLNVPLPGDRGICYCAGKTLWSRPTASGRPRRSSALGHRGSTAVLRGFSSR